MLDIEGLKVTFIAGTLGRGGAERQLFYITDALRSSGATAEVLCLSRGEHWEERLLDNGIPVTWVGKHGAKAARLRAIVSALRRRPPDVIQSQHFYTNLYAVAAARCLGHEEIGAIRSDCTSELRINGPVLGRLSLRVPKVLAANSREGIRNACRFGVEANRLVYVRNLVDFHAFHPQPQRSRGGPLRLLWIGRLDDAKRPDRFLEIFDRVVHRTPGGCIATLVGDGALRSAVESLAGSLEAPAGSIVFHDSMTDLPETYRAADVLVLTSDHEGTPNVVLEAMASGLPVVASDVGGVSEVVGQGTTGFLFNPGNENDAVDAVLRLIRSPSLREKMGAASRSFVVDRHSKGRLKDDLSRLYELALRGRRSRLPDQPTRPGAECENRYE